MIVETATHTHRIVMANLGYARCIDGSLSHHARYGFRHLWCPPGVQRRAAAELKSLVHHHRADLCCLLEVDTGSLTSAHLNQMDMLTDAQYRFADAESKYAETSPLRRMPLTTGKSNGFIACKDFPFEKIYFSHGTKRLVYRVMLEADLTLFFTHFSLTHEIRTRQLLEIFKLADECTGEVIIMGDFNILKGFGEINHLIADRPLVLMNDPDIHTFAFHRRRHVLDLCICSESVAERSELHVIPQHYSDHAALLLEVG